MESQLRIEDEEIIKQMLFAEEILRLSERCSSHWNSQTRSRRKTAFVTLIRKLTVIELSDALQYYISSCLKTISEEDAKDCLFWAIE